MIEAAYDPIRLLQSFIAKQPQGWGGSPGREIPKEELEKMNQPGTPPPEGFFEEWRQRLGQPGVKQAVSPSFDLSYPKIPGRNVEGVPNANDPVMREKLRQRLLRNPEGGQDLPGFLKKA
jgi:hypothetical protein